MAAYGLSNSPQRENSLRGGLAAVSAAVDGINSLYARQFSSLGVAKKVGGVVRLPNRSRAQFPSLSKIQFFFAGCVVRYRRPICRGTHLQKISMTISQCPLYYYSNNVLLGVVASVDEVIGTAILLP